MFLFWKGGILINQVLLIGRIIKKSEIEKLSDGSKKMTLTLNAWKDFYNDNEVREMESIECTLWNSIAINADNYLSINDLVGIKGSLKKEIDSMIIDVDRITFISSLKPEEIIKEKKIDI